MSASVTWTGLEELRRALRDLPEDLTDEAGAIVQAQALEAARQTVQQYPLGPTGNLRRRVTTDTLSTGRLGVAMKVRSRAPHAHIFERGTRARRTGKGWFRGVMPEAPMSERMIPVMIRRRRIMLEALKALVRRAGFTVE